MNERIAVATALDVPYATLLGEAVATRLARLTADLAASREAWATLAAAVRSIGDLIATHGCSCDCDCAHTTGEHISECDPCLACRMSDVVSPLLSAAPAPTTVPAALVRAYLAAEETMRLVAADDHRRDTYHEWAKRHGAAMDAVDAARAALVAGVARCAP